jgi:hypothetical protein
MRCVQLEHVRKMCVHGCMLHSSTIYIMLESDTGGS